MEKHSKAIVCEEKYKKIAVCRKIEKIKTPYRDRVKLPQFTTMHVIEGQANQQKKF